MRYAQLVIGPAGSGKSTYCSTIYQHISKSNKRVGIVNLDPAAEYFNYEPIVDIRELIHIGDVMDESDLKFGPNGGLIFCMEYLLENQEWLRDQLGDADEDYLLFDCPGQIELFNEETMINLVKLLQNMDFVICVVFLIDSQFMVDGAKFMSGSLAALYVMINLELPQVNILNKMDLLSKSAKNSISNYLDLNTEHVMGNLETGSALNQKYRCLTGTFANTLNSYNLVSFFPLNIKNESSISDLLANIESILQSEDEADVKTKDFGPPESEDDD